MAQAQNTTSDAVSALQPLSYLNSNQPATVLFTSSAGSPQTTDRRFKLGTLWLDTSTTAVYSLVSVAANSANWSLLGPGASDVDTLTGDSGGAVSPTGGTITMAGGTNVTTVGTANTITFNLDAAITLATSVTSALYTTAAGTDLLLSSVTGQDTIMKMGDNAGANKVSFTDSDDSEVFAIDSNGGLTLVTFSIVGAFTQTGGVVSISEDNSANAVGIANGTTARAITFGSSAAAHTIAIGSVTGAASLDLKAGTGNFTLEGDVATTYDISATGANTGTITIAGGTGIQAIDIATGGTGAKTVNIGTGAIGNIVTIGTVTAAASLDLLAGTGNFTLEGATGTTYGISATGANTGQIDIGTGTGAQTMNLATGGTGIKTVNIATGAIGNIVTIGSVTAAASLDLLCGTGDFTLEGDVASTYQISATGANTGQIDIGTGTGAQTMNLATGGTGVKTVNIATGAIDNDVIIGTVTGTASLRLLMGTGNFSLDGAATTTYTMAATTTSGTIDIGGTAQTGTMTLGDSSGTNIVQIGSGEGATTVNIADGATNAKTVNIGTGAVANTTTIGTISSTATTTILAGTGGITMTGTIENVDAKFVVPTGININFNQSPVMETNVNTGGVPTGAAGDINLMTLQEGVQMEQFIIGTQTIIAPRMTATGLLTSLDLTNAEGAEYNFGAVRSNSQHAFTIGTSPAFFFELEATIADVSGCEPFLFGFRIVQANDAAFVNYTDLVGYGTNDGVSPGDATIQTQLNGGGLIDTDTNDAWADAGTHTLKVLVSAAGVVTFTFDGSAPTATQAFTFDNADVVVPYIHHLFNAAAPGAINLVSMQIGFQ